MITFELDYEYGGWKTTALPDDLRFVVQTPAKSITLSGSLEELLRAYGHIYHEKDGVVPVYTSTLEFTFHDDTCCIDSNTHSTQVDTRELKATFENLLSEIFESKDETDPENRREQLEYVSTKIREKDIEYNVVALYEEAVGY